MVVPPLCFSLCVSQCNNTHSYTNDCQGIVTASRLHNGEDPFMATSTEAGNVGISFATEEGDKDKKMAAPPLVNEGEQEEEAKGSDGIGINY